MSRKKVGNILFSVTDLTNDGVMTILSFVLLSQSVWRDVIAVFLLVIQ